MTARRFAVVAVVLACASIPARGQPVLLRIHPRVGDTLSVRMDQKVEMTGTPLGCVASIAELRGNARQNPRPEVCSEVTRTMTSVMEVFSRAIVRQRTPGGAMVLAVTDSIRTSTSAGGGRQQKAPARVKGRDERVELKVSSDGSVDVVDADASEEMRALFGQMPATLPGKPVAVGEKWTRQMRIPIAGRSETSGFVRATFHLDSLGKGGEIAYLSMRGTLSHDQRGGADSDFSGSMSGSIQLDRRIGWISETRAVIDVTSVVQPAAGGRPMRVRTRITQLLQAGSDR